MQIRELVVEYAEAKVSDVKLKRGLTDLSLTFLRGSIFGHPSLPVMGRFNRIHVGATCPKNRLRDLLRLLKPGEPRASPASFNSFCLLVLSHGRYQMQSAGLVSSAYQCCCFAMQDSDLTTNPSSPWQANFHVHVRGKGDSSKARD